MEVLSRCKNLLWRSVVIAGWAYEANYFKPTELVAQPRALKGKMASCLEGIGAPLRVAG
jgi:hypothetical protein